MWINMNTFFNYEALFALTISTLKILKSHQKKHKQKKSHLMNRPFYFQRLPMADENAIFLTMKDQVGSIRNFREYKRNESSFPHPVPGRVVQLPMLDPGL